MNCVKLKIWFFFVCLMLVQEKSGYFFCLEDRAILCRQCDVGVHTATPHVSDHHRFLVTGVRVGLEQCTATVVSDNNCRGSSNFVHNNNSSSNIDVITTNTINSNGENDNGKGNGDNPSSSEVVSATSLNPEIRVEGQWQWSDILSSSEFEQCYEGFSDFGFSSVADDHWSIAIVVFFFYYSNSKE